MSIARATSLSIGRIVAAGLQLGIICANGAAEQHDGVRETTIAAILDRLRAVTDRDYRVCVEMLDGTTFLSRPVSNSTALARDLHAAEDVTGFLAEESIPFVSHGDVIVLTDPQLAGVSDNPMDEAVPRGQKSGNLREILARLGLETDVGLAFANVTNLPSFEVNVPAEATLRMALLEVARRGGVEWIAEVTPPSRVVSPRSADAAAFVVKLPRGSIKLAFAVSRPLAPRSGEPPSVPPLASASVTIGSMVAALQSTSAKDYYLCVESVRDSHYLERPLNADVETFPTRLSELRPLLDRLKLWYMALGSVCVLQDDTLVARMDNPLESRRNGVHTEGGIAPVCSAFGVSVRMKNIEETVRRAISMRLSIEHPITLREALVEATREYHCEWIVEIDGGRPVAKSGSGEERDEGDRGMIIALETSTWVPATEP